ncbi:hypothetical protein HOY82DRAFT_602248 [Tuber indicum]|nr:hypothetical protein HOY82DRAFT_602248 [Tuber indicum]
MRRDDDSRLFNIAWRNTIKGQMSARNDTKFNTFSDNDFSEIFDYKSRLHRVGDILTMEAYDIPWRHPVKEPIISLIKDSPRPKGTPFAQIVDNNVDHNFALSDNNHPESRWTARGVAAVEEGSNDTDLCSRPTVYRIHTELHSSRRITTTEKDLDITELYSVLTDKKCQDGKRIATGIATIKHSIDNDIITAEDPDNTVLNSIMADKKYLNGKYSNGVVTAVKFALTEKNHRNSKRTTRDLTAVEDGSADTDIYHKPLVQLIHINTTSSSVIATIEEDPQVVVHHSSPINKKYRECKCTTRGVAAVKEGLVNTNVYELLHWAKGVLQYPLYYWKALLGYPYVV